MQWKMPRLRYIISPLNVWAWIFQSIDRIGNFPSTLYKIDGDCKLLVLMSSWISQMARRILKCWIGVGRRSERKRNDSKRSSRFSWFMNEMWKLLKVQEFKKTVFKNLKLDKAWNYCNSSCDYSHFFHHFLCSFLFCYSLPPHTFCTSHLRTNLHKTFSMWNFFTNVKNHAMFELQKLFTLCRTILYSLSSFIHHSPEQ